MRLLITGTGRCGTRWITRALREAGIDCRHEAAFNPNRSGGGDWQAEAAWHAAPHTPLDGTHVVHLVRHPLATIRSRVSNSSFHNRHKGLEYAARWLPELQGMTLLDRAAWHWVAWNRLVQAQERVRLEAVTPADVTRWARLVDPDAPGVEALPAPGDRQDPARPPVTWGEVAHMGDLAPLARAYGYLDAPARLGGDDAPQVPSHDHPAWLRVGAPAQA